MGELKVMKARRALDPAALRDPLGEDAPAPTECAPQLRRTPKASSRPAPRATVAPARSEASAAEATTARRDLATVDLVAGPRSAVAVMFDPDLWIKLVGLAAELRA